MVNRQAKFHSQSGVSLVELLVVMIIIALVASIAFMSRGSANEIFQRQNGSYQLKQIL
jgi:prepilin-type N-terminal cleavage/methylation domain-containing protein